MSLFKQAKVVGDRACPGHETGERCISTLGGLVYPDSEGFRV
jgi:hypothetical protein